MSAVITFTTRRDRCETVGRALRDFDVLTRNLNHVCRGHPAHVESLHFTVRNFAGFDSISEDLSPIVGSKDLRLVCLDPRGPHSFTTPRESKWLVAAFDEAIAVSCDGETKRLEPRSYRVLRGRHLELSCSSDSKGPCRVALQGPENA